MKQLTGYDSIAVLLGGDSPEREVSLASGTMVLDTLKAMGCHAYGLDPSVDGLAPLLAHPPSISLIMLHGGAGENGQIQAWHDLHVLAYTGSNSASCAIAMHKHYTKALWRDAGLSTPRGISVTSYESEQTLMQQIAYHQLIYPLVLKPEDGGSSVYLFVVADANELAVAWQQCHHTGLTFLIEEYITGEEYTVAMLAGEILPSICIQPASGLYDYHAKYHTDSTQFTFGNLSSRDEARLCSLTAQAFKALGVNTWGRVDCIQRQGEFYFLEANLIPGMTDHSLLPAAAAHVGITYADVIARILTGTSGVVQSA